MPQRFRTKSEEHSEADCSRLAQSSLLDRILFFQQGMPYCRMLVHVYRSELDAIVGRKTVVKIVFVVSLSCYLLDCFSVNILMTSSVL